MNISGQVCILHLLSGHVLHVLHVLLAYWNPYCVIIVPLPCAGNNRRF